MPTPDDSRVDGDYKRGLALSGGGDFFAAHEAFEAAWRAAAPEERDFFQGLVHAVVFAYQSGRGRPVGAERQREKALRRLARYAPVHRALDVEHLLAGVAFARAMGAFRWVRSQYDVLRFASGITLVVLGLLLFFHRDWWLRVALDQLLSKVGLGTY